MPFIAVSAFYAENPNKKIACCAHIWTKSKFLGLSVGVECVGQGGFLRLCTAVSCHLQLVYLKSLPISSRTPFFFLLFIVNFELSLGMSNIFLVSPEGLTEQWTTVYLYECVKYQFVFANGIYSMLKCHECTLVTNSNKHC